ncbi:hypothetical protein [Paludisphaera sp.]|uniref:hypothetical protein n=1 Tax=Paludisphaera sp. TaxID=2017432 RepID=UPI00301DB2B5
MEEKRPKQTRTSGREHKVINVTLPEETLEQLAAVESTLPGIKGRSATIRYLADKEYESLRREGVLSPPAEVVKTAGGWGLARRTPAGLEIVGEYPTRKRAEAAAAGKAEPDPGPETKPKPKAKAETKARRRS